MTFPFSPTLFWETLKVGGRRLSFLVSRTGTRVGLSAADGTAEVLRSPSKGRRTLSESFFGKICANKLIVDNRGLEGCVIPLTRRNVYYFDAEGRTLRSDHSSVPPPYVFDTA